MNLLAVETSGQSGTIALLRSDAEPEERSLDHGGRRHAQSLVADADALLKEFQLTPADVSCIAVSLGPGSFTGLRVGIVFAKTFSWINQCPIVAVPTFDVCAEQVDGDRIVVISDAQRGEIFSGEYASMQLVLPEQRVTIQTLEAVRNSLTDETILTGPGLAKYAEQFAQDCQIADESKWLPRAATVAKLGAIAARSEAFTDPWSLEPFYLRRSAAEEKRDANKQAATDS